MTQILFLFVTRFRHFEFRTIESWDLQRGKGIPIPIQEEDESFNCRWFPYSRKRGEIPLEMRRDTRVRVLRGRKVERGKDMRTMNARISARFVGKIAPRGPAVHVPRRDGWTRWERGSSLEGARREEELPSRGPFHCVSSLARPHLSPRFSEPKLFSCLSFVPVSSERASLAATALLVLSSPPPPPFHFVFLSFSFLFFFFAPSRFQSIAAWNPERARGSVSSKEERGEGGRKEQQPRLFRIESLIVDSVIRGGSK